MSSYIILLYVHVCTAFASIAGFFVRGIWMMQSSSILQMRWVRIVPHVNDTVLLLSAIALAIITTQYPGPSAWLNAKIIALIIYIVLGIVALNRGKTKGIQIASWGFALLTYAYILTVAFSKNVLPI